MKKVLCQFVCVVAVAMASCLCACAGEIGKRETAPVTRVDLFKNGFAVVTHTLTTEPGTSEYIIDGLHNPVHGTLWAEARDGVSMKFFTLEEQTSRDALVSSQELLKGFVGEYVQILLFNEEEVEGVLRGFTADSAMIVLEADEGTALIKADEIVGLYADKKLDDMQLKAGTIEKSAVRLSLDNPRRKQDVALSYLTRGMSWAPSYRLDLGDGDRGRLRMKTAIRNELADMENADVFLISGFPSIKFQDVITPADPDTSWAAFFSALSSGSSYPGGAPAVQVQAMSNMMRAGDFAGASSAPSVPSDDYDIHYLPAGKLSLNKGEAAVIPLGDASITYERVVQWHIPDNMDTYGGYRQPGTGPDEMELQQDVWDAVKFDNPFDFPMTTAAIAMYQNNAFLGQSQSLWTAPGQEVFTRITKAMNIKVDHSEAEVPDAREDVRISNQTYTKTRIRATVTVKNSRGRKEKIVIRRRFSGRLLEVTGNPEKTLMPEGATRLNERNQLVWEVELAPGREFSGEYIYEIVF